jgi:uncharacterized protein (TIGR02145 family)
MKSIHSISGALLVTASSVMFFSCTDKTLPPVVATLPVTSVSFTTAVTGGAVTYEGGSPVANRGVCWNTSTGPTIANNKIIVTGGFGAFTCTIAQLTPNTLYYLRAWATSDAGTGYGNQFTFTTKQSVPATITTAAITAVVQTRAVSGGNVSNENGGSVTARGICWSTTADPTIALNTKTTDGTGPGSFISNITQLIPGTTYYVRAYATNIAGTSYGNQITFTTSQGAPPTLTTAGITSVTPFGAISGGNITNEGGLITANGICWSTEPGPTTGLSTKTVEATGSLIFVSNLTSLQPGLTYYVRAYATNDAGTSYGEEIVFNSKIADADGNTYNVAVIGSQVWMVENLKTTSYSDHTGIPLVIDNSQWAGLTTPGYSWYNNDASSYKNAYGALYNWYAIDTLSNGFKNVCPLGWHLPADEEWAALSAYLGGESVAGGKLKESGMVHWQSPNTGATNSSGFTALPGGGRDTFGTYYSILNGGLWWTGTEDGPANAWIRSLLSNTISVDRTANGKRNGYSVRCVKDF